jgi:hypothetical protein
MKREEAVGLAAVDRRSPTVNEELTGRANGPNRLAPSPLSWDPYEVWRTRVKGASTVMQERKRERLRWRLRLALRRRRLPTTLNARP